MTDYHKNIPIRHWAEDDRPREKLLLKGKRALSNAELIAILLATGGKEYTALLIRRPNLTLHRNPGNIRIGGVNFDT